MRLGIRVASFFDSSGQGFETSIDANAKTTVSLTKQASFQNLTMQEVPRTFCMVDCDRKHEAGWAMMMIVSTVAERAPSRGQHVEQLPPE